MIRFARYILGYRPTRSASILLLLVFTTLLEACGLLALAPLLASFGAGRGTGLEIEGQRSLLPYLSEIGISPTKAITLLAVLVVVRLVLGLVYQIQHNRLRYDFYQHHRTSTFSNIISANWQFQTNAGNANLVHASTDLMDGLAEGMAALFRLVGSGTLATAGIAVSLLISPALTALLLVLFGILAGSLFWLDRRVLSLARENTGDMAKIHAKLSAYFNGLKTIKTLGLPQTVTEKFSRASTRHAASAANLVYSNLLASGLSRLAATLCLIGILVYAVGSGDPLLEPLVIVLVFSRVLPNLQAFHNAIRQFVAHLPDFETWQSLNSNAETSREELLSETIPFRREIRFRDVNFSYEGQPGQYVLDGVNAVIKKGTKTGIIGPTGAGKTTFADLLAGLFIPKSGNILVDGSQLEPYSLATWRQNIAYVTQEEYLFPVSLRENFELINPGISEGEIFHFLELATAAEFVTRLDEGLDTMPGDRGHQLSRGQRQKFCLARALASARPILIMDEATGAIPPMDEKTIMENLVTLQNAPTLIVISHRLSALQKMDQILVVDEGKISSYEGIHGLQKDHSDYVRGLLSASDIDPRTQAIGSG